MLRYQKRGLYTHSLERHFDGVYATLHQWALHPCKAATPCSRLAYTLVSQQTQVVLRMMEEVHNDELIKVWTRKMAPPLVTLLSAEPEVQYVALRNINLIVQRWPQILAHEVKVRPTVHVWGIPDLCQCYLRRNFGR